MKFEFYAVTHSGLIRKRNEDYFSIPSLNPVESGLAVVADGMGGHKAGEVASRLAVETFVREFETCGSKEMSASDKLSYSLDKTNESVYSAAKEKFSLNNMGTTLTACYLNENKAVFINVGDSRAYIIHDGTAEQITRDHSMVQELLQKDIITEEEAINHPQKNIITRAIGIEPEVRGDLFVRNIAKGDCIVLCTDGLNKHIPVENMGILFDYTCTVESIANTLKELALVKGGTDNVTVVIVRCIE